MERTPRTREVTDDGQWAVQVYPGDTLYTPMSDQAGCLLLSQTDTSAPEYALIWRETYKVCGATFDPNSPFHQRAIQLDIGTPLTGVVTLNFEGANYQVQVTGTGTTSSTVDAVNVTTNNGFFGAGSTTTDWQLNNNGGAAAVLYATNAVQLTANAGNTAFRGRIS